MMRPAVHDGVYVDFETVVADGYSLGRMSARQYISDPRFKILCVTVAVGRSDIIFYHDGASRAEDGLAAARDALEKASKNGLTFVSHNVGFDGLIAALRWGVRFPSYFDTAGYARHLGIAASLRNAAAFFGHRKLEAPPFTEESLRDTSQLHHLARYCATDTLLARTLFEKAIADGTLPDAEFAINDHTCQLNLRGLNLDPARAREVALRIASRRSELLSTFAKSYDFDTSALGSTKRVLGFVEKKFGVTLPSLDQRDDSLRVLLERNPEARQFIEARRTITALGSAISKIHKCSEIRGGSVHNFLTYNGAHTGRFTAGRREAEGLNVHGMLKPENSTGVRELGEHRTIVVPPPGARFVAADLSTIEARVIAYLADERELLRQFAMGTDIYIWFMQQIMPGAVITKDGPNARLRKLGKECVLGLGFGMGLDKFLSQVRRKVPGVDAALIEKAFSAYQQLFPAISRLRRSLFSRFEKAAVARLATSGWPCPMRCETDPMAVAPTVVVSLPTGRSLFYRSVAVESTHGPYGPRNEYWYAPAATATSEIEARRRGAKQRRFPDGQFRDRVIPQTIVENVVQAVARDLMAHQVLELERRGLPVSFHAHDEVVAMAPPCACGSSTHSPGCSWSRAAATLVEVMSSVPTTLPTLTGLPVACELNGRVGATYAA